MVAYYAQLFLEALAFTLVACAIGVLAAWALLHDLLKQLRRTARRQVLLMGLGSWVAVALVHLFLYGATTDREASPFTVYIGLAFVLAILPGLFIDPEKDPHAVASDAGRGDLYLARSPGGETLGPMSYHELKRYCHAGRIRAEWAIRHQDEEQWLQVGSIDGLNEKRPPN